MADQNYLFVEGQVLPASPGDTFPDARVAELARRLPRKVKKSVSQAQFAIAEDATNIARVDASGALLVPAGTIFEFPAQNIVAPTPEDVNEDVIPANEVAIVATGKDLTVNIPIALVTPIANFTSVSPIQVDSATAGKIRIHGQTGEVVVTIRLIPHTAGNVDTALAPITVAAPAVVPTKVGETIPLTSFTFDMANSALDANTFYWGHSYAISEDPTTAAFDQMWFEIVNTQQIIFHFRNLVQNIELHAIGFQPASPETSNV